MHIRQFLFRLQFDDYLTFDQQIKSMYTHYYPEILNRDLFLEFNVKAMFRKLNLERFFINTLKETRAQFPVDLDRRSDNLLAEFIKFAGFLFYFRGFKFSFLKIRVTHKSSN